MRRETATGPADADNPTGDAVMLSRDLLANLRGESWASIVLLDLFVLHGRRPFRPRFEDLRPGVRQGRGARQKFALSIAVLHVKRHIRWLPGDRYRIVSREVLTADEHRDVYGSDGEPAARAAAADGEVADAAE